MNSHSYRNGLWRTFADHRKTAFPDGAGLIEDRGADGNAPTVFKHVHANRNIMVPPNATPATIESIQGAIAPADRHKWFASMGSSQALCQSVFGGLHATGNVGALAGLLTEDGRVAFDEHADDLDVKLEHKVNTLNEPRQTSIDAYFFGSRRIAVEVKFAESEFGTCSRPRIKPTDSNYARDYCDGSFTVQRGRSERCSLTSQKILYWQYIPKLLNWSGDSDFTACPLSRSYQLVRNLLAATVNADGSLELQCAHVLVIYDNRNPAFAPDGVAQAQWTSTIGALRFPHMLRKVSWQNLADHLAAVADLRWLVEGLRSKYGIVGGSHSLDAERVK
jgi:hypothetical protein